MARVIYDVTVSEPGKDPYVIRVDESGLPEETSKADLAERILSRMEAALERAATGPAGTFRIGGHIIPVTLTSIPRIEVEINTFIRD